MSLLLSQFIPSFLPLLCPQVHFLCLCLFSCPENKIHQYHFSRFHIYMSCDICFCLSDLLHSVWQALGLSTSLQLTQFHSYLWLSNTPLYICTENCHMTQKSHYWTYTLRRQQFKRAYVPQCSLQHYLQEPGRGSNLIVLQQMSR